MEDELLKVLRRCGHHLHHNVGKGTADTAKELFAVLSEEEKQQLLEILNKCLQNWSSEKAEA